MKPQPVLASLPLLWACAAVAIADQSPSAPRATRPNVLLIAIDDQNDWLGHLGGHPLARSPHLDALAARGTTFTNAHCQAPLCNPSRASLLTGLRPSSTGIHGLVPSPALGHPAIDWGAWPPDGDDTTKGDYAVASWTIERIRAAPPEQPFFIAAGFFLPHVPCYATPRWFEPFPDDDTVLPPILEADRADTPRFSWYLHWTLPEPRLDLLREMHQWRNLVRSYLACTSFVDAQIGRVLEALDESGHSDDTIVVVWSDHGWHLGEKGITGKNTLWERSTRVPLIVAGPGVTPGQRCGRPVELLDIYPTLVELAGVAGPDDLEGQSLAPLLRDASAPRERPAITTHNRGNHAVRSERWRYIRYADGSEELYDHQKDPNEWHNLAGRPEHAAVIAEHARWLPTPDVPAVPGSGQRVLSYDPRTDVAVWEGRPISRTDPLPTPAESARTTRPPAPPSRGQP